MHKYTTVSGDQWDFIAYREMGSEAYTHLLIAANTEYATTCVFSAGVELVIPDAPQESARIAPPWRRT